MQEERVEGKKRDSHSDESRACKEHKQFLEKHTSIRVESKTFILQRGQAKSEMKEQQVTCSC